MGADTEELRKAVRSWNRNSSHAALVFGDISNWDVSKVTDMSLMFKYTPFNGDLSKWDVSKVTNMNTMFYSASSFNGDLSKWDVSKVWGMSGMFEDSDFNGDLSKWDVSKVTSMYRMFLGSKFNGHLSKWDVCSVTDMHDMFASSQFNGDLSKWNVSRLIAWRIVGKDNQAAPLHMLRILLLFLFGGASHEDSRRLWLGRVLMENFRQPSFAFVSAGRVHEASIC